eukprot:1459415-Rhodomonas_salina.1
MAIWVELAPTEAPADDDNDDLVTLINKKRDNLYYDYDYKCTTTTIEANQDLLPAAALEGKHDKHPTMAMILMMGNDAFAAIDKQLGLVYESACRLGASRATTALTLSLLPSSSQEEEGPRARKKRAIVDVDRRNAAKQQKRKRSDDTDDPNNNNNNTREAARRQVPENQGVFRARGAVLARPVARPLCSDNNRCYYHSAYDCVATTFWLAGHAGLQLAMPESSWPCQSPAGNARVQLPTLVYS